MPPGTPSGYARFLTFTDGPACGTSLTFWGAAQLHRQQYLVQPSDGSDAPLDPDHFFCRGLFDGVVRSAPVDRNMKGMAAAQDSPRLTADLDHCLRPSRTGVMSWCITRV